MEILRTPDERFKNLSNYPFCPNYIEITHKDNTQLRMHYVDEGPQDKDPILLMHGEPSWSFLYRKMIPILARNGYRTIAPDLIGFCRSDKPALKKDYTYQTHVDWMKAFIKRMSLKNITLVCQDWGSLIGLRLVAENQELFSRVVLANGGLLTGHYRMPKIFYIWQAYARYSPWFPIGRIVDLGCKTKLSPEEIASYNAPFPNKSYKSGARIFPMLVPTKPDDPSSPANRKAWEALKHFSKPFLTAFSDKDPITRGMDKVFQKLIPGAKNQPHTTIKSGGHFLQEDCPEELSQVIINFIQGTD